MQFRTEIDLSKSEWDIDYNSKLISIGSCFSSHMAHKLEHFSFDISNNPYGTFYNPISIFRSLAYEASDFKNSLIQRDGMWVSYLSHSDITSQKESNLLGLLERTADTFKQKIQSCDFLILTLGSAKVYKHRNSGLLVANCHKVPQKEFDSRLLEPIEIINEFDKSLEYINSLNPNIKIILTVSPVRYLSDGFQMNSLSKAILIYACHVIINKHNNSEYFPAYEMIIDDLRDYRFFEEDLLHPNSSAVKYVWNGFKQCYLSEKTVELMNKVDKITKSLNHIPFNTSSEGYKTFLSKLETDIEKIKDVVNTEALLAKLKELKSI